jgi:hypothetical protein
MGWVRVVAVPVLVRAVAESVCVCATAVCVVSILVKPG